MSEFAKITIRNGTITASTAPPDLDGSFYLVPIDNLPRWVPVAERLPEVDDEENFLVCDDDGDMWVGLWSPFTRSWTHEVAYRELKSAAGDAVNLIPPRGMKDYEVATAKVLAFPVSHWMPLPTPPEDAG